MAADADPPPLSSDPAREPEQPSRRPNPSPWLQQKVPGYAPLLTPRKITVALFVLGVAGICVGLGIRANDQHEVSAQHSSGAEDDAARVAAPPWRGPGSSVASGSAAVEGGSRPRRGATWISRGRFDVVLKAVAKSGPTTPLGPHACHAAAPRMPRR